MAVGAVVWITGLPAAGKTTLAEAVAVALRGQGTAVLVVDGDRLRAGLCRGLGWAPADRRENIRRAAELGRLAAEQGQVAICALVSPAAADRALARTIVAPGRFLEIHVCTGLDLCRARDPRGLYARAAAGELTGLTGVDAVYEPPIDPAVRWDGTGPVDVGVGLVLAVLGRER